VILVLFGAFGDMGLVKNYTLYKQKKLLGKDVVNLQQENRKLRREADNLMGNPRYIEKIAREEFNMSRKDEVTFVFREE